MEKIIYLDMDGVIADFREGAAALYGKTGADTDPADWYWMDQFAESRSAFWRRVDSKGAPFWANLPEYPWASRLVDELRKIAQVIFCTKPGHSPSCCMGKLQWLQSRYGRGFKDYIFTEHKQLLSFRPNVVLVDDDMKNAAKWNGQPGTPDSSRFILFPQPYNDAWEGKPVDVDDLAETVRKHFEVR